MVNDVKQIIEKIDGNGTWSVKLLKIHTSTREGLSYMAREINMSPHDQLKFHVEDLRARYVGQQNEIGKFNAVTEYDGTTDAATIYTLNCESDLIKDSYIMLMDALANADHESDAFKEKYSAYVISGTVENKPIYIFSMASPFVNMKRKFISLDNSTFTRIDKPVLSLRLSFDVVIYDNKVYMFTMAAENLFNMDRAYKAVCANCIEGIVYSGILIETDIFKKVASSGSNPRRFVSYNSNYLERLRNKKTRERIGKKFDIPMKDGLFDTEQDGAADKIVKLLCKKGMVDPFDDTAVEVSGSKKWS